MLLCVIYMAFISLGLPDSLLGAAWPAMRADLGAPIELAGALAMICSGGTILSSLMSTRLIRRFGTGRVTLFSVVLTAVALVGYALAPAPWVLLLCAIPLGLGAGGVDTALNNYVSLHYAAKHMSWLHCFWGVGATTGPLILSACMAAHQGWRTGYFIIIGIQAMLVVILAVSLPLWRKRTREDTSAPDAESTPIMTNTQALRLPGIKAVIATFFCYCAVESSTSLWTASYMTELRGCTSDQAALAASLFFMGITVGRGFNGFLAIRYNTKTLIRVGCTVMLFSALLMLLAPSWQVCCTAAALFGLGCAPIYPSIIHETPERFGAAASQAATALQMATAYLGSTFMPPLFGLISGQVGLQLFPWWMLLLTSAMIVFRSICNRREQRT